MAKSDEETIEMDISSEDVKKLLEDPEENAQGQQEEPKEGQERP